MVLKNFVEPSFECSLVYQRHWPIGKIAELLGGDVRGSEVLCPGRPAMINRISWQPIPVDAP